MEVERQYDLPQIKHCSRVPWTTTLGSDKMGKGQKVISFVLGLEKFVFILMTTGKAHFYFFLKGSDNTNCLVHVVFDLEINRGSLLSTHTHIRKDRTS